MNRDAQPIEQLIAEAVQYQPGSPRRQYLLSRAIRLITPHLWKECSSYYDDALQQVWLYFLQNIDNYDSSRSTVVTWLNYYLRRRLQDLRKDEALQRARYIDTFVDVLDTIPAPEGNLDWAMEREVWAWVDSSEELRKTHLKGHPFVNCQFLIKKRLPPVSSWQEISKELGIPIPTLASFYQRQCWPRLRKFGEDSGYL